MSDYDAINNIAAEIAEERVSQDEQWGPQDHPSFLSESLRRQYADRAEHYKLVNQARVDNDCMAWDSILLEEVYEALAETEPTLRRAELIQVAAVAAAEVEALDRMLASFDGDDEPDYKEAA